MGYWKRIGTSNSPKVYPPLEGEQALVSPPKADKPPADPTSNIEFWIKHAKFFNKMAERSEFIIRCSMFNVRCWTFKKCFTLPLTSIFYSRRNGRTFPGPPIESVGLDQTKETIPCPAPYALCLIYIVDQGWIKELNRPPFYGRSRIGMFS